MNRRRFLKVAGIAGLSVMAPIAVREGRANSSKYKGPFWIMVNAGGGWDPTMLCDPKGGDPMDPKAVNHYDPKQIGKAGAQIQYAPVEMQSNGVTVMNNEIFFNAHHQRLLVLNGVDNQTNNHDAGTRTTWCGQLSTEGFPSLAAMIAATATAAHPVPLAFLSYGGYDTTGGLISLTRVGGTDAIQRLAFTNNQDPNNPSTDHYHTANTAARIASAQEARIRALQAKQSLPNVAEGMSSLYLARQSDGGLSDLGNAIRSAKMVKYPDDFPAVAGAGGNGSIQSICTQAQIALLAFQSGVAVSANLSTGGFDTHSDHDNSQRNALMTLLFGLDYLFNQIDAMGLTNDVYVVVGSDFGRTPIYNMGGGKDHWNITSMLMAGPKVKGDRVVGATDAGFISKPMDLKTLQLASSGSDRMTTAGIHLALRKLSGVAGTDADKEFGIAGDPLPLFS